MLNLLPADSSLALKEWSVAVNALRQGKQILILRKGGVHRDDKQFRVVHPEFLLFPTFEHQKAELVKPAYHADLKQTEFENDVDGLVTLSCFGVVTDLFEIADSKALERISDYHIWTDDYAEKRLHWRPNQPLTIPLLRTYTLTQPQALPILEEYVGCRSWVDLGQVVPMGQLNPVLSDADYETQAEEIRIFPSMKAKKIGER